MVLKAGDIFLCTQKLAHIDVPNSTDEITSMVRIAQCLLGFSCFLFDIVVDIIIARSDVCVISGVFQSFQH